MMDRIIPGAVIALTVAFVLAILIASARGEPKNRWDRDHETHHELGWPDLAPPSVACPDQQTLDEVEALRRLGDREDVVCGSERGCRAIAI